MTNRTKQLGLSFAMLAIAVVVTSAMYWNRPPTELAEPEEHRVTVDVVEITKRDIRIPIQAQGTVTPEQQTALTTEIKGRIIEVSENFNVGSFIGKGEVLLRIDPRDYQTHLLRAQAAVASAESNLAQEKGRAHVARREWNKLPKGSQRSPEAKDLYLRVPQSKLAEAQLLAAMADLDTAKDNLGRTIISAPYDALIRNKHIDLGQFVAPGNAIADIFSVDYAQVRLAIPQTKLAYLELPGITSGSDRQSTVDLYTDVAGQISHWPATLHRTEGVFDERSRVLFAVARIVDPYALQSANSNTLPLRIGTFVNARIQGRVMEGLVMLPRHILRAGNLLWVIDGDMKLRNRKVAILRTGGDMVYVSKGLENGDLVSLTVLDATFSGATVEIISRSSSESAEQATLESE